MDNARDPEDDEGNVNRDSQPDKEEGGSTPSPSRHNQDPGASTPTSVSSRHSSSRERRATLRQVLTPSAQLSEIEMSASRTNNAVAALTDQVKTLEGQVTQMSRDISFIKSATATQNARMDNVKEAVEGCQEEVATKGTESAEAIKKMNLTLYDLATAERDRLQETMGLIDKTAKDIQSINERLDEIAKRNRSNLWSEQLKAFLEAQRDANVWPDDQNTNRRRPPDMSPHGKRLRTEKTSDTLRMPRTEKKSDTYRMPPPLPPPSQLLTPRTPPKKHPCPSMMPTRCKGCKAQFSRSDTLRKHLKEDGSCPRAPPGTTTLNKEDEVPPSVAAQQGGSTSSTSTSAFSEAETNRIAAQIKSGRTSGKTSGKTWMAVLAKPRKEGGAEQVHNCGRCNFSATRLSGLRSHVRTAHGGVEPGREDDHEDDRDAPGAGAVAGEDGTGDRQERAGTAAGEVHEEESTVDSPPENIIDVSDNEDDTGDTSDNAADTDEHGNLLFRSPFKSKPSQRRESGK